MIERIFRPSALALILVAATSTVLVRAGLSTNESTSSTGLAAPATALPLAAPTASEGNKYIGAPKCKNCHGSKDKGDQYAAWSHMKHAQAFETLQSDAAKEVAQKLGLGDPSKEAACLRCHVTAFGEPKEAIARGFKPELGVQCETCHGPGEEHMKVRFKAAAAAGDSKELQTMPEGEIVSTPGVDVCLRCHNPESPSYQPFCYFEARGKIAHLDPRKPRTDEEKANFDKCPSGTPCAHAEGCPEGKCNLKPEQLAAKRKN